MLTKPDSKDVDELKTIWKKIFKDTDSYIDLFFSHKFECDKCFIFRENGRIYSALYYFDITLTDGSNRYKCAYICGIGTLPEKRGLGIAGSLIKACIDSLRSSDYDIALLIPADASLFEYYKRFGFNEFSYISNWHGEEAYAKKSGEAVLICDRKQKDIELLNQCYGEPVCINGISYYKTGRDEYTAMEYTEIPVSFRGNTIITAYNPQSSTSRPFTSAIIFSDITLPEKKYISLLLN